MNDYFGATTLFNIAMMQVCECSANTCFAEFSNLQREFLDINFGANVSKSYYSCWAIKHIAIDVSLVIYDLKSYNC